MTKEEKLSIVLWKLRTEKGLSQLKLANKANIDVKYYRRLEHRKSSPTFKTIVKITEALEINLSDFMRLIEEQ